MVLTAHVANLVFGVLGIAACVHWARHRGRARAWLAAALGLLGLTALISPVQAALPHGLPGGMQLEVLGFMGSGYALVELRHALVPMPRRRLQAFRVAVFVPTFATLLLPIVVRLAPGQPLTIATGVALVSVWAACVAEPAATFW